MLVGGSMRGAGFSATVYVIDEPIYLCPSWAIESLL